MRLTPEQLVPFGEDAYYLHLIDTVFAPDKAADKVGVAVSGGGDSMALLHLAARWSALTGVPVVAVTLDHGLRAEAGNEANMVARFSESLGLPHHILKWDGLKAQGNLAAAGRDARYTLIGEWAVECGIDSVLLGHTVDDVAETFLMRLARKSGVDGLSAMESRFDRAGVRWGRPLWQQKREELRGYLRRHSIDWVDDPTNEDETYDRPKARQVLAALAPLGIDADVLKTVALNMSSTRRALENYTRSGAQQVTVIEGGDVLIDTRSMPPIPAEIQRRILVAALRYVGGKQYAPRSEAVLDLEVAIEQVGKHTLAGCLITKTGNKLRVSRELQAVRAHEVSIAEVWDSRWVIDGPQTEHLTVRALGESLKVVPDWRDLGLPRASLMVSPAVFDGETLISAPVAGYNNGFDARIVTDFSSFLLSR